MAILGPLIMLMIKSYKCASPHEQVAFIRLKQAISIKFVQLENFGESGLEHSYNAAMQCHSARRCVGHSNPCKHTFLIKSCYTVL